MWQNLKKSICDKPYIDWIVKEKKTHKLKIVRKNLNLKLLQNSKTWIVTTSGWQRIKNGFKGRGWEGRIELDQVEGREIMRKLWQVLQVAKTA